MTFQLPGFQDPPHCPRTGLAHVGAAGWGSSPGSSVGGHKGQATRANLCPGWEASFSQQLPSEKHVIVITPY